jgi:hypothetical protein
MILNRILKKKNGKKWSGFILLQMNTSSGLLEKRQQTSGFHTKLAYRLLAFVGFGSM